MRVLTICTFTATAVLALLQPALTFQIDPTPTISPSATTSRSDFVRTSAAMAAGFLLAGTPAIVPLPAVASDASINDKLVGISDAKLKEMVTFDVVENQFLSNGKLTRSIYDETATFTDEIDTYGLDQWMKGTQKLFVAENSNVKLVGDVDVTNTEVTFRFDEDLQFRIPLLFPTVSLTGKVVLKRDSDTGLITSYQEFWDQSVSDVLKTAKFNFGL